MAVRRTLSLTRETLADLTPGELAGVAGGTARTLAGCDFSERGCPTISPEWCHTILAKECLA